MKKLLLLTSVFVFLIFSVQQVHAQGMMGGVQNSSSVDSGDSAASKDEAAGKLVWDNLQGNHVTCKDLKDDDFDVLGDFFMGNMMGSNHDSMNQLMAQRLGDDGEKQMHITLGKRLSGCDTNAALPNGAGYFMPMMGLSQTGASNSEKNASFINSPRGMMGYRYSSMFENSFGVFGIATWFVLMMFLISASLFFLKEILKKSK